MNGKAEDFGTTNPVKYLQYRCVVLALGRVDSLHVTVAVQIVGAL
jgi:hypothetical protein